MILSNCTCGTEPVCESGSVGARNWSVCCFNCGARSAIFPNRTEAVMSWNDIVEDNLLVEDDQLVAEKPFVSGLINQALQHIRGASSAR